MNITNNSNNNTCTTRTQLYATTKTTAYIKAHINKQVFSHHNTYHRCPGIYKIIQYNL